MSDNSNEKNVRNDEIDLLDLMRRMGNGLKVMFRKIGTGIIISIVFMLRNWIYLSLSVILGVGVSYIFKYSTDRFYKSEMVISSNTLPASDLIAYINKLHTFSLEKNNAAISVALNLDPNKSKSIKDIQAYWIIDVGKDGIADNIDLKNNHDITDTLNVRMETRLAVQVIISSPQELSLVRDGILKFIETNPMFMEENKIRLSQINELLVRLNDDITLLDSLQKIKYFEEAKRMVPEKGGQMIFLQEQKTQLIYDNIHILFAQRQDLEKQKEIFTGVVTLLSDFTVPVKPKNGARYYGKVIIPLFFGLCILILVGIRNRTKLTEVYRKY